MEWLIYFVCDGGDVEQQDDEAPDPRCEDLGVDEELVHACAECWEQPCICDPETM